jgi:hypothetical protein
MACRVANVMRQGCADALVTEEPYEGILHVRVCGGTGWETAGPTRQGTGRRRLITAGLHARSAAQPQVVRRTIAENQERERHAR